MAKDSDMVEAIIEQGGGAKKTTDLPTPKEIIAKEKNPPAPPVPDPNNPPPDPKIKLDDKTGDEADQLTALVALREKIEKGETLSAEEAILYSKIDELEEEVDKALAPPSFNIGGKVFTEEEIDKRVRVHYKLGELKISDDGMKKLREDFVANENKKEANRKINAGFQENASTRQEIAEEKVKLHSERARLDVERQNLKRMQDRLQKQQDEVNAILKNAIAKEDVYDENHQLDPDKFSQRIKQQQATERAGEIAREMQEVRTEMLRVEEESIRQEVNMIIADNPQYQMSEPIEIIADKMAKGITIDEEDDTKFQELYELMTQAKRQGRSVNQIIKLRSKQQTLAVKPTAQAPSNVSGSPALPKIKEPSQLMAEKIRRLEEKVKNAPVNLKGGTSGKDRKLAPGEKRESTKMVEEGRRILGKQTSPFLKELDF